MMENKINRLLSSALLISFCGIGVWVAFAALYNALA